MRLIEDIDENLHIVVGSHNNRSSYRLFNSKDDTISKQGTSKKSRVKRWVNRGSAEMIPNTFTIR